MDIAKQDIAAIVQISGQTWVITNSGQWIPAQEVTSSLADIEVITLTAEQIDLNAEQPQVFVNGQWLTLPSQVITSITTINENNQPSTEPQSSNQQSANERQQGNNFFYQFIQRSAESTVPESGFDTTGDTDAEEENNVLTGASGEDNGVLLPELSITIADGGDEWVNQFETPSTDLFGEALYASDGQSLTVTLTDINGNTLSFTTTAQNQAWQINDIDLSAFAEGQIVADIQLTTPLNNADISAQDTSVKDTLAEISLSIQKVEKTADNVLIVSFSGDVTNIQDGQAVTVQLFSPMAP